MPGTTKIESLLHALLLQFDLLIKGTEQFLRTPSKMGDVESKESCFERDEKIKALKFQNGASNGMKIMRKPLHLLGVDMSCVSPLCISLRTAG